MPILHRLSEPQILTCVTVTTGNAQALYLRAYSELYQEYPPIKLGKLLAFNGNWPEDAKPGSRVAIEADYLGKCIKGDGMFADVVCMSHEYWHWEWPDGIGILLDEKPTIAERAEA